MGQVRQAVRSLTSGLPRLWRASRAAGVSRRDSLDIVWASFLAFSLAARGGATRWRRQNAVRHFSWQAYLAARHGEQVARALGEAQERGSSDAGDSEVDEANNRAGRAHGLAHREELRAGGRTATLAGLARVAERKWQHRELSAQPLADGSDPRDA